MGSSIETVAFQVYEILKIDHEFLQFFDWDQKYKHLRHHFQYLAQFIAPRGGSGQFEFPVSTTMELPLLWSPQLWIFLHYSLHGARFAFFMVSI